MLAGLGLPTWNLVCFSSPPTSLADSRPFHKSGSRLRLTLHCNQYQRGKNSALPGPAIPLACSGLPEPSHPLSVALG